MAQAGRGREELLVLSMIPGLTLVTALFLGQSSPPVEASGGIVAIVGDEVITNAELERACEMLRADLLAQYPPSFIDREWPRLRRDKLERMIEDKLILQLVKKEEEKLKRPYVSEEDVDHAVRERLKDLEKEGIMLSDPDDFYALHRDRYGMKRDEVRNHLKKQISIGRYLWQQVFKGSDKIVSPEEQRCYYRNHLERFSNPVKVSFRMILINRGRLDAPTAVEQVEKGIKAGTPFVELASQWSDEAVVEGKPKAAGRLWEKTFEDLKKWRDAIPETLRKMKQGEVSPRLDTVAGIHYLKVEDIVAGAPKSFQEAQPEIEKIIVSERNLRARDTFITRLRKKTRIEVLLPPLPEQEGVAGDKPAGASAGPPPAASVDDGRKNEKKENQAE